MFLQRICFIFLFLLVSCANDNSNSSDLQKYGPIVLDSSDPNFLLAYPILKNKCVSCHTHDAWSAYTSNALWISKSRAILKNNANGSPLIQQIQIGAMPQDGSISSSETQTLENWINNMP